MDYLCSECSIQLSKFEIELNTQYPIGKLYCEFCQSKKERKIINFFKKNKYALFKKKKFWQASLFCNIKAADYLFISNEYLKSKSLENSCDKVL